MNIRPQRSSTTAQSDDRCEQMLTVPSAVGGGDPAILGQAFHASPYASFIVSSDGLVLHHNRRAGRLYMDDQDIGAVPVPFAALTDLRDAEMLHLLRQGAARGYLDVPMIVTSRSKQRTPTVFRVAVLRAGTGGDHLYLLTQDHLKSAAEALGQMNKRRIDARNDLARSEARYVDLHASLLAMESFAYKASHDLRTPLNTLSGLMDLFASQFGNELPDKARDYLSFMTRAVGQMDALTTDFLEHARSASAELAAEPLDLGTVLRDVRRD
ncbi:MAG: histidine kinase dimerization/phospho-acceptor domain-containing protein, partial [Tateyamaria sp.]